MGDLNAGINGKGEVNAITAVTRIVTSAITGDRQRRAREKTSGVPEEDTPIAQ